MSRKVGQLWERIEQMQSRRTWEREFATASPSLRQEYLAALHGRS